MDVEWNEIHERGESIETRTMRHIAGVSGAKLKQICFMIEEFVDRYTLFCSCSITKYNVSLCFLSFKLKKDSLYCYYNFKCIL